MSISKSAIDLSTVRDEVRSKWGWFVALGVVFVLLEAFAFAHLITATAITIFYIGALMMIGGIVNIAHAFQERDWPSFWGWLLSGVLYGVAGIFAFINPLLAASTLTLLLSFALIAAGFMRIGSSVMMRSHSGWAWVAASGLVTLAGVLSLCWAGRSMHFGYWA
jgi:uncharacterized membrane protein HdeD (DUF308 family)